MKASIKLDKSTSVPKLVGNLGITNVAGTAFVELTHPDGEKVTIDVPAQPGDAWVVTLDNKKPGAYVATIRPCVEKAFEGTRLAFSL